MNTIQTSRVSTDPRLVNLLSAMEECLERDAFDLVVVFADYQPCASELLERWKTPALRQRQNEL